MPLNTIKFKNFNQRKILTCLIVFMFIVNSLPVSLASPVASKNSKLLNASFKLPKSDPSIDVIPKKPVINHARPVLKFSQNPSDNEILCSHVFIEPLIPLSNVKTNMGQNKILASDLMYFQNKQESYGFKSLDAFIKKYPDSKWTPSLEVQLATIYFSQGYFIIAMAYWLDAFNKAKNDPNQKMKLLANEAISKLLEMNSRVGRIDEIKKLLELCKGRKFSGSAAARLKNAKDNLWAMTHSPGTSFECGPFAVNTILKLKNKQIPCSSLCNLLPSTIKGTNMYDVAMLANKLNLPLIPVKIAPNVPIPLPAIVHWKLGHYSAVTGYYNGKYHVQDATFGVHNNFWLDRQVFNSQASGEYLILADNSAYSDLNLDKVKAKMLASGQLKPGKSPANNPALAYKTFNTRTDKSKLVNNKPEARSINANTNPPAYF